MLVLDWNCERSLVLTADFTGKRILTASLEHEIEFLPLGGLGREDHINLNIRRVNIRSEVERLDVVRLPGLQINRLPYSTGISIALLAVKMGIAGGVVSLDDYLLGLTELDFLKLALEGDITSLMATGFLAVKPDLGVPIGCSDHQEYPLAFP